MKTISGPLLTLMQSTTVFTLADLYTITLVGGAVLRFTDFDVDLPFGGNVFSSSGPVFKRGKTRVVIGLEVDTLDVEIYPKQTDLVNGLPMLAAAAAGSFDRASLKLERAYIGPVPVVVGAINLFSGIFADVSAARAGIKARINSDVAQFNISLPRNLYQAACLNALYSTDCGLSRAAAAVTGIDSGGSTVSLIKCTSLPQATGFFNTGYATWTSGALSGLTRTIKGFVPGSFSVYLPLPNAPANGDHFTIYPGCDKALSTCISKGNKSHFRGCPFIPVPETAV